MPSAYRLVMDKIEQSRAIMSGEVWHDDHFALLLELLANRIDELERGRERNAHSTPSKVVMLRGRMPASFQRPGNSCDNFSTRMDCCVGTTQAMTGPTSFPAERRQVVLARDWGKSP